MTYIASKHPFISSVRCYITEGWTTYMQNKEYEVIVFVSGELAGKSAECSDGVICPP